MTETTRTKRAIAEPWIHPRQRRAATKKEKKKAKPAGNPDAPKVIKFKNGNSLKRQIGKIVKKEPPTEPAFKPIPAHLSVKYPKSAKVPNFTRQRKKTRYCNKQCPVCCKGKKRT